MCKNVLVIVEQNFSELELKKEFHQKTKSEIKRITPGAIIQFVYKSDKNSQKTIERHRKVHPLATEKVYP